MQWRHLVVSDLPTLILLAYCIMTIGIAADCKIL